MKDYALPDFDQYRQWINNARSRGRSWDEIATGLMGSEEGLEKFLRNQSVSNWWDINKEDWAHLVELQRSAEEQTRLISISSEEAIIVDEGEDGNYKVPTDPHSSWQLYRKKLIEQHHFTVPVVDNMERSTLKILKRLHAETKPGDAVKGLIIGNVQSGKTANMTGLMAMSADWGWNMFIVLSGTIENLRKQTQSRLFSDLNDRGNLRWMSLEHLSKKSPEGNRAQDLHFEKDSNERYFTVCLKNSARLRKLIQWLLEDPNKQQMMRILVIDDEADQAGVNTSKIYDDEDLIERKRINELLVDLVSGKNEKKEKTENDFKAMNYVGYTATPYANVLNEAGKESLYPRSFISTLGVSKEYFGPQQVFGVTTGDYDGLDIIRIISKDDLNIIKEIHDGDEVGIPVSLKQAICWFIDGVACRRLWKAHEPVSMLIHTSQKTDPHTYVEEAIIKWFHSLSKDELMELCHETWDNETRKFPLSKFREQYPDYAIKDENINDYPSFNRIEPLIKEIISLEPTHISMGDDGDLHYNKGIHICVDNCKNNGVNADGIYMRLTYPTRQEDLDKTPAFIVIGGQTLSRGLTLKGLTCTYFLRSVGQADTLMQMGRWFGYRPGYELLMRVWLTEKTNSQFKFLSDLDQELRDEIYNMDITGKIPANYGPRVKNSPKYSFIRITAKNRMQSAQPTDLDYSGSFTQTYLFDDDYEVLHKNLDATMDLLKNLGAPKVLNNDDYRYAHGTKIWEEVGFETVKRYLQNYILQKNMHIAGTMDSLIEWIGKITSEGKLGSWNIVLSDSTESDTSIETPVGPVHLVTRTRKNNEKNKDGIIDIGALRNPKDLLADVNYNKLNPNDREVINNIGHCSVGQVKNIRNKTGLENVPQLIIYLIDKGSRAKAGSSTRLDLNAPEHIAGYCLNIPGGKQGQNYTATVSIHMDENVFDGESDLEEINGN